jgi:HAD superfamily hydrolase (TIGR01509 family)
MDVARRLGMPSLHSAASTAAHDLTTPRPHDPSALLWDIDGTLIDTTHLVAGGLDHVYRVFVGRTLPMHEIRALIGIPLSEQVRIFGDPREFGTDSAEMEAEFIRYWEARKNEERVVPEAVAALIAGKRAGRGTALVTSKNHAEIANTLPRIGIAEYVDAVITADDVNDPKPHPEGVLLALSRLGVDPDQALFIGDTVHDLRAGQAAGVRRCAVTWGAAPRALLVAEAPDLMCDDPADLMRLLGL